MIRVECGACGKAFSAKDEHAGKSGKCPACGASVTLPALPAASPAPLAPAPPLAPTSSGERRRTGAGGRRAARRSSRGKDYTTLGLLFAVVGVGLAIGGYFAWKPTEQNWLAIGVEHLTAGRLEQAVAALQQVPSDDASHAKAQEYVLQAQEMLAAGEQHDAGRRASLLYERVKAVEKWATPDSPNYAGNTRYLLKCAQAFLAAFPEDPRVKEIKQLVYRFSDVASLQAPPRYEDVEAELNFLLLLPPDLPAAISAVDEYRALGAEQAQRGESLRARVVAKSLEYWQQTKARLLRDGSLTAGAENWQRVANEVGRYLEAVAGAPGLTEAADARALYEQALAGG